MNHDNRPDEGYTIGDGLFEIANVAGFIALLWWIFKVVAYMFP